MSACRHVAQPTGEGVFRFLPPPEPPSPTPSHKELQLAEQTVSEVLVDAEPILPLANPVYPAKALAARAGWAMVSVQITVDVDGRVSEVSRSLVGITSPTPFAAEFQAAVEAAVRQWRFRPAELRAVELREIGAGQKAWIVTQTQSVTATYDVAFSFDTTGTVAGSPVSGRGR